MIIEIESNKDSIKIDPYCCVVKPRVRNPGKLATLGYIPREISRHAYFFLKEEGRKVEIFILSTKYKPSPIPAGWLEIPLMLSSKSA